MRARMAAAMEGTSAASTGRGSIITEGTMASPPRQTAVPNTPWRTFQGPAAPAPSGVSFGGTLTALAIAVGLGVLGAHMLDLHGHTCDRCGRRWVHLGAFNLGDEQSHTCARCGEVQWWKCGAPHVLRGSEIAAYQPFPRAAAASPLPPAAYPAPPTGLSPSVSSPMIAMGGYAAPSGGMLRGPTDPSAALAIQSQRWR
jgi:hypothetical protein